MIDGDSDDPEERRKKLEAQQSGSNLGAVLGLAIGAAIAMQEHNQEEATMEQKM